LAGKRLLLISGFFSPLCANLNADCAALSVDLVLETGQGFFFRLHFFLLRIEFSVERVELGLQLIDANAELPGVDVGEFAFSSCSSSRGAGRGTGRGCGGSRFRRGGWSLGERR